MWRKAPRAMPPSRRCAPCHDDVAAHHEEEATDEPRPLRRPDRARAGPRRAVTWSASSAPGPCLSLDSTAPPRPRSGARSAANREKSGSLARPTSSAARRRPDVSVPATPRRPAATLPAPSAAYRSDRSAAPTIATAAAGTPAAIWTSTAAPASCSRVVPPRVPIRRWPSRTRRPESSAPGRIARGQKVRDSSARSQTATSIP